MERAGSALILALRWSTYVFILAPMIITCAVAFTPIDYATFPPPGFSLRWFFEIFEHPQFLTSFAISFFLATATVLIVVPLGLLSALAVTRFRFSGRATVSALLLAPLLLPGVVIGISMLQLASRLGLVGSPTLVLLGTLVLALPYTFRLSIAGLSEFDWVMERASLNLGATSFQTFRRIVLPMIAPAIISSSVLTFILAFDETTVSLFLSGPNFVPLGVRIFNFIDEQSSPMINAISLVLIVISIVAFVIVDRTVGINHIFGRGR